MGAMTKGVIDNSIPIFVNAIGHVAGIAVIVHKVIAGGRPAVDQGRMIQLDAAVDHRHDGAGAAIDLMRNRQSQHAHRILGIDWRRIAATPHPGKAPDAFRRLPNKVRFGKE